MPYKILFFGTSEFAVPSLRALLTDSRFEVVGIVTQPDRPVGRHAILTAPPIKQAVLGNEELKVHQPETLKDDAFQEWLRAFGPECDAFVVVSYGKILPKWLIELPKKGVINVHGSLLPRWRGAAPIQAAIAAGDKISGVTVMCIDEQLDHGPIIALAEEPILPEDTGSTLHDRLAKLGGAVLHDVLADYLTGAITPEKQDHDLATECKTLTREDGKLDFTKTAEKLERIIRAYTPWPGTWMMWQEKRLKIHQATIGITDESKKPGELFADEQKLFLACAEGTSLQLLKIQQEGKTIVVPTSVFLH